MTFVQFLPDKIDKVIGIYQDSYRYLSGFIAVTFLLPYMLWIAAYGWPTIAF